jgi:hypothetical protein
MLVHERILTQPRAISEDNGSSAHARSCVRGGIGLEDTVLAEGLVDEERFDALRGRTVDFSKEELLDRLVTGWSSRTPSSASRMMYLLGR